MNVCGRAEARSYRGTFVVHRLLPESQDSRKSFDEGLMWLSLVRTNFAPDSCIPELDSGKWCKLFLSFIHAYSP